MYLIPYYLAIMMQEIVRLLIIILMMIAGALIRAMNLNNDSASGLPKTCRLPITRPITKMSATGKTEFSKVSIITPTTGSSENVTW